MYDEIQDRYEEWGFPQDERIRLDRSLRINPSQKSEKEIIDALKKRKVKLEKIPFLSHGFNFKCYFPISTVLENLLGYLYIQEAPAQIPAEVIKKDISFNKLKKENIKILDMCAAPGGKTTQLSEVLNNKGLIVAIDNRKDRVQKLKFNLERMKVKNCNVHTQGSKDLNNIVEKYGKFDYILLDAPCSGNFTSEKRWFDKRTLSDFRNRQRLQMRLLEAASEAVKKGGIIIYSTCSLEKEENEEAVEYAIEQLDFTLESPKIQVGSSGLTELTKSCIRIWPSQHKMPGFFVAKLRKN